MKNLNNRARSTRTPKSLFFLFFAFSFTSCGYQWLAAPPFEHTPTVELSFIPGDQEGLLLKEVALALTSSGPLRLASKGAHYRLDIALTEGESETIGFRFDQQDISGVLNKNLVAAEGRRALNATVTLYETSSDKIALGPYTISSFADYDYLDGDSFEDLAFLNAQGEVVTVLPFSLGQLEPKEAAYETASLPLYRTLARKIADALYAGW